MVDGKTRSSVVGGMKMDGRTGEARTWGTGRSSMVVTRRNVKRSRVARVGVKSVYLSVCVSL